MSGRNEIAVGWHADQHDPMTTRYWNGRTWTSTRRWSGTEWVELPLALPTMEAPSPIADRAVTTGTGIATGVAAALKDTSTTFKVFVGAAFAWVLGYFVPVTIVSTDSGYSEARSLTDAGGFGVLILAAAAATVWLAWSSRQGVVGTGALWGLGAMVAIIAFFTSAVMAALGQAEEELAFTTTSQTVSPSLGLLLLLAGVVGQVVGIGLAIRDRRRLPAPRSATLHS